MLNRRSVLTGVLGSAFLEKAGIASAAQSSIVSSNQDTLVSEQAQFVADAAVALDINPVVVVLDKTRAELIVFNNSEMVMKSPALYGKVQGETKEIRNATPAGIFNLQELEILPTAIHASEYKGGRVLGFLKTPDFLAIHPTWNGAPAEQRDARLASATVNDNAISNGCVNVPFEFYNELSDYLKAHCVYRENDNGLVSSMPRFVVLPKNLSLEETRRFFNFPAFQRPQSANINPAP